MQVYCTLHSAFRSLDDAVGVPPPSNSSIVRFAASKLASMLVLRCSMRWCRGMSSATIAAMHKNITSSGWFMTRVTGEEVIG